MQDLFRSAYVALVRPRFECGIQACSQNLDTDDNYAEVIQGLATRLVNGIRHLPYEEQRRRHKADPKITFKVFTRRGVIGYPYKVPQGKRHHLRRGWAF